MSASQAAFESSTFQGSFQNYGEGDYAADFKLAQEAGIDAFAMNVGRDSTDPAQLAKAFSAAKSSSFKLFFSFDMNYFSKPGSSDAMLSDYLGKYGGHDAHLLYNGKVLVSTFSGEVSGIFLDGAGSFADSNAKWTDLLAKAKTASGRDYAETLDDKVFAAIFVPQGSKARKVVTTAGGPALSQDIKEGVNLVSVAFRAGKTSLALVDSSNKELLSGAGADIVAMPTTFDFNFRSYILPEDATASKCFGNGAASAAPQSSGIATTATASKMSLVFPSNASVSSSAPLDATDLDSTLQPSQSLPPISPASATPQSSASSTSELPSAWLDVPTYGWIAATVVVLVLPATRSKPTERTQGRQTMDESDSGDGSSSDGESSDSADGLMSRRRNG
ncbi:hypothetical protein JCM10296v2_001858 [Rhodotorula toruloides]